MHHPEMQVVGFFKSSPVVYNARSAGLAAHQGHTQLRLPEANLRQCCLLLRCQAIPCRSTSTALCVGPLRIFGAQGAVSCAPAYAWLGRAAAWAGCCSLRSPCIRCSIPAGPSCHLLGWAGALAVFGLLVKAHTPSGCLPVHLVLEGGASAAAVPLCGCTRALLCCCSGAALWRRPGPAFSQITHR